MCTPAPSVPQGFEDIHNKLIGIETISMNNVEILPTDVITDSLLPLPKIPDCPDVQEKPQFSDIPEITDFPVIPDFPDIKEILDFPDIPEMPDFSDIPDIPENVIVVPALPLPTTSESVSYPIGHKTTVTGSKTQLTYVTHRNVSLLSQPNTKRTTKATSTTINVPTTKEAPFKQPILLPVRRLRPVEWPPIQPVSGDGPSAPKKQKTDETVFLSPVPVTVHAEPLTRITKNIPKPKTTDSDPNKLIKALLARKSTPYLTRGSAPRTSNFNVGASTQTHTTTVDTVITTHVTTATAITTPMTVEPQLSYAISPIRATTVGTTVTTTVTWSTQSKTSVPVQRVYKAQPDTVAVFKKILKLNLVGSRDLPTLFNPTVTTPVSITTLGPQGSITTSVDVASSVQRPAANTHAKTHNYTYLEPGKIKKIEKGPRSICVVQQQATAAMQQQATIISKMKAAKHVEQYAESQAGSELEIGSEREVQHASLAALQEASHAHLVAASTTQLQIAALGPTQTVSLHTTSQSQILGIPQTERVAYSQTQGQPLAAYRPQDESLTNSQLQSQSLTTSNLQSQSLATSLQPAHGNLNVQLLTSAQAQLHATPQGQINGIPQTQRIAFSQAQGQPMAAPRPQDESLANSQLQSQTWTTSHLQGQILATSQQPDQLLASPKPQGHHLAHSLVPTYILATSETQDHHLPISQESTYILATSQAQLLTTSQSQGPIYITSQRQAPRLAKSQSQGTILVAPQRHALLATTQSQGQLLATLQANSRAILPTQPNVIPPVQIKSTRENATLIAQLNAPSQKIVPRGQQNVTSMQLHTTPEQLKNITEHQLNTVTLAQLETSQWGQQATSPTQIQMSSPPQPSAAHGQPDPRNRRRLIIRTAKPALPLDKTPIIQSAANETVAASTSLNAQHPGTSSASQQIGDVPSSSIHTTSTLTLSTGTNLVMPHYKTTVFKNLSSIGRTEPTRLPTPMTTSGERMVIRRPVTIFPARRTFPTTTQSSTATTITTSTTTATTPFIHIIRTVPRHMLGSLDTGNARVRPDGPRTEVPTHIITPPKPKTDEE